MTEVRDLEIAEHEAAHVVVGASLGLWLKLATVREWGDDYHGFTFFPIPPKRATWAETIMTAAGVAWERSIDYETADESSRGRYDWEEILKATPTRHDAETAVTAAAAILAGRMKAHRAVTKALLERDISAKDLVDLVQAT